MVSMLAKEAIPHEKSRYRCLTISCGPGCSLLDGQVLNSWEAVVEQADQNLYKAKEGGRNCVVVDGLNTTTSQLSLVETK